MQSTHTPGPWHRNIAPASKYNTIFAGRNTHVAHLETGGLTAEEIEGNCDLIAAAPEMLDALKRAQRLLHLITVRQVINAGDDAIDASGLNPYCMNEGLASGDESIPTWWLDAAIAKAEGRQ